VNRIRVLLVDDEEDFVRVVEKRLRKREVDTAVVTTGHDALAELEGGGVDVVVLDVRMPGMDGLETLEEIKRRHPDVEVIMLTGHASLDAALNGMELGAFDYLMKPMDIDDLLYRIEDAYEKKTLTANEDNRSDESDSTVV
jgi:DNA-binding NtrC family response regulator